MPASARQLQQLMDSLEPGLARAFRESVDQIRRTAVIQDLEDAIASNDIERALRAAGIRDYTWTRMSEAVRESFKKSGEYIVGEEVPTSFGLDFSMSNPRAQRWIETRSSNLVTELSDTQREAIRFTVSAGFEDGRNPRSIALDIVGRIDRQTGNRTGGVVGLHRDFADASINARRELQNLDSSYFRRQKRDRRFDAMVRKAIDNDQPLSQSQLTRVTNRYQSRLLKLRGDNISRTEALSSMNSASEEAMEQVVDEGLAERDAIDKIWDASGDSRVRTDHRIANGQTVKQGEAFVVGGYRMMHPGDMSAPVEQVVNCRCVARHQIDFSRTQL